MNVGVLILQTGIGKMGEEVLVEGERLNAGRKQSPTHKRPSVNVK